MLALFKLPVSRGDIGTRGEYAAVQYLKHKGYRILDRNVRAGRNEIDIVCQEKDTIIFVEVRTRTRQDDFTPEDSIGPTKQRHVRKAVLYYMNRHFDLEMYYRIDVVAVTFAPDGKTQIKHIEDAFT